MVELLISSGGCRILGWELSRVNEVSRAPGKAGMSGLDKAIFFSNQERCSERLFRVMRPGLGAGQSFLGASLQHLSRW